MLLTNMTCLFPVPKYRARQHVIMRQVDLLLYSHNLKCMSNFGCVFFDATENCRLSQEDLNHITRVTLSADTQQLSCKCQCYDTKMHSEQQSLAMLTPITFRAPDFAANMHRMPVPQPTSSTTLFLNKCLLWYIESRYVSVRTSSFSISCNSTDTLHIVFPSLIRNLTVVFRENNKQHAHGQQCWMC